MQKHAMITPKLQTLREFPDARKYICQLLRSSQLRVLPLKGASPVSGSQIVGKTRK